MQRLLPWINAVAIPVLAGLCVAQWWHDRDLQLHLRECREELSSSLAERQQLETRLERAQADLELFRDRYQASEQRVARLNTELRQRTDQWERCMAEAEQTRAALTNWMEAVRLRDQKLEEAASRILELNARVQELADRYRQCVTNHQSLLEQYERMQQRQASRGREGDRRQGPPPGERRGYSPSTN
ncbi:MAG: hypothetical protein KatS3mg132_482 [Limisphaera sp.]|nr:MAG: hypothetical protein KatS3mg132_482 [Limisphaera sp.]